MFIFIVIMDLKLQFHYDQKPFCVKRLRYPAPACDLTQTSQSLIQCPLLPEEVQWFQNQVLSDNCKLLSHRYVGQMNARYSRLAKKITQWLNRWKYARSH